jgi:FkbM family methyltransferase
MMTIDDVEALCHARRCDLEPLPMDKIVLYGAGHKGREILQAFRSSGRTVAAFIDQGRVGKVDDVPVFHPDEPRVRGFGREGYTAVVSAFNAAVDPLDIHSLLVSLGFDRVISTVELRQHMAVGETYWLGESRQMKPPAAIANALWRRFRDLESTNTLAEAVALRQTLNPKYLRGLSAVDQYAPATVPTPRGQLRFVDGGAYDGDTLRSLTAKGCSFNAAAAFEPDPENFARLACHVFTGDYGQELALFPCGLGSRTAQVQFRAQGLASSSITTDGELLIQTVSLDECMPRFRPNYVKLDIEGAEASALKGMARTIQSSRPALAVCVYHKPADLWEIPMLIDELLPDSDFYLRAHAWNGFELVFYAVPHEMART